MNQPPSPAHCPPSPAPRTALITGASRGIGRAIALKLAADGFQIAVHYNSSSDQATAVVDLIRQRGGTATAFQADLNNSDQTQELPKQVTEQLGPIHTLVCNAGIIKGSLIPLTTLDDWREVMTTNLESAFLLTKGVARTMARLRSGRIIYISSDAALLGDLMRSAYSASKSGLLALAKTAARELAPSQVTVNAIAPGLIETDLIAGMPETRRAKQLAAIPLGRFGKPEEIASVVRFLASDDANWITGQTIPVDGGLWMRG